MTEPAEPSPTNTTWRFFDAELVLTSDVPGVNALAASLYHRFQAQPGSPAPLSRVVCRACQETNNPSEEPPVWLNGEVVPLPPSPYWAGEVCDLATNATLACVYSHLLFHCASVSWNGRGVLLVGNAHQGKTSLAVELVRRGWRFLGDDIAALGRADRALYPFPKSLRLWPDTLEQSGFAHLAETTPFWAGKHLVDIEQLYPASLGSAVPLSDVLVLTSPDNAAARDDDGVDRHLDVLPEQCDESLMQAISALEAVRALEQMTYHQHTLLRLRTTHRQRAAEQVQTLCAGRGVPLLYVGVPLPSRPSFAGPARLEPLSARLGVLALLRQLRVYPPVAPGQNARGGGPRLFMEIVNLLCAARCHALHAGPLGDMADLVCDLVAGGQSAKTV